MAQVRRGWPVSKQFEWFEPRLQPPDVYSEDTERGRIYHDRSSGMKFWSMTTFLGLTESDPEWYERWVASVGQEKADAESQRCCERGESIHSAIELYVQNRPFEEVRAAAKTHFRLFQQLRRAVDTNISVVYGQELPVFSPRLKLGGRLDLFARWAGAPALIDWKGSNFLKTVNDIEDYKHQLCGYSLCLQERYGVKVEKLVNVIANERSLQPTIIVTNRKDVLPSFFERLKRFHAIAPPI